MAGAACVLGGGEGLGRSFVKQLLLAGHDKVVVVDLSVEKLAWLSVAQEAQALVPVVVDLSEPEAVRAGPGPRLAHVCRCDSIR